MTETYQSLTQVLDCLSSSSTAVVTWKWWPCWWVCRWDIQSIGCILCEQDRRAKTLHFVKKDWPGRKSSEVGGNKVQHPALVATHNISLPSLNINLGLTKNFVKVMDHAKPASTYLVDKFPRFRKAQTKTGILCVLRWDSSSAMRSLTTCCIVLRKWLKVRFVWWQLNHWKYQGRKLQRTDREYLVAVWQTWLHYVLKVPLSSFPLGFLSRQIRQG